MLDSGAVVAAVCLAVAAAALTSCGAAHSAAAAVRGKGAANSVSTAIAPVANPAQCQPACMASPPVNFLCSVYEMAFKPLHSP